MNPFALLLLAAVAGGGRIPGFSHEASPVRLDRILDQLHGAVNTLETVSYTHLDVYKRQVLIGIVYL